MIPIDYYGTYQIYSPTGSLRIARTRTPMLDAARVFLAMGEDPVRRIEAFRKGCSEPALISTVGWAAKVSVRDDEKGIKFVKFRSYQGPKGVETTY